MIRTPCRIGIAGLTGRVRVAQETASPRTPRSRWNFTVATPSQWSNDRTGATAPGSSVVERCTAYRFRAPAADTPGMILDFLRPRPRSPHLHGRDPAPLPGTAPPLVRESCRPRAPESPLRLTLPSTPPRPHHRRASTDSPHHHGCGFRGQRASSQVTRINEAVDGSGRTLGPTWAECARRADPAGFLSFSRTH